MSDPKSKIPDIGEITSMASKLFKDIKKSITEIITDYKANHCSADKSCDSKPKKTASSKTKSDASASSSDDKK